MGAEHRSFCPFDILQYYKNYHFIFKALSMSAYNVTYVIEDCSVIFIHMVDFSHFNFSNSETLILQKKKKNENNMK